MIRFPRLSRYLPRAAALGKRWRFWFDVAAFVRPNGALVLAAMAAAVLLTEDQQRELSTFFDPNTFYPFAAVLLGAVVVFYIAMVILPYAWFVLTYYLLRRDRNQILFKFPRESCVLGESFDVDAILQRKLRLVAGTIKFRLVFHNYDTTDWYFLLRSQRRRGELFNSADRGAIGSFALEFLHLGRYRTRYSVVKFEDPLGLFSLPIIEKEYHPAERDRNFTIYSVPAMPSTDAAPYFVRRRNVPSVSEQKFKVAEDFFDNKRYEPTDDSRRLMWQVYARTRELLVRIPERDSVVDADLDLHVLFYNSFAYAGSPFFRRRYDAYVQDVARFLEGLLRRRALSVRLFTDDSAEFPYEDDPNLTREENLKRALVSASWHNSTPPAQYFQRVAARRHDGHERILILNPFIALEEVPWDETGLFHHVYLLGGDIEDSAPRPPRLVFRSATSLLDTLPDRALVLPQMRRMRMNCMQLAARCTESA